MTDGGREQSLEADFYWGVGGKAGRPYLGKAANKGGNHLETEDFGGQTAGLLEQQPTDTRLLERLEETRRALVLEVKKVLREEGLQYSLIFPTKLRIVLDGATHNCDDPEVAWEWTKAYKAGTSLATAQCHLAALRTRAKTHPRRNCVMNQPTTSQTEMEQAAKLQAVAALAQKNASAESADPISEEFQIWGLHGRMARHPCCGTAMGG
ncbi:hypothetical protein NDU88_001239 [Pleurodeles waltl]|uniref:Uncharacterized protein n=1 Tax=Pleurodeles waltl TaxID=8319 RepID=A0AAV7VWY9_PLEWA|nr:hypothetical protein NDU88_001239 [Pleurodeles waltl]